MSSSYDKNEISTKMDKSLSAFKKDLSTIRTGRANPAMLDLITIEVYGKKMPINQLATITVPEARSISIQVWDKSMVQNIEKAIRESELGLNPSSDGQLIRVPLPDLTEERRLELTKVASKFSEDAKISIRNIRRDAMDKIKEEQKNNQISEDEQKTHEDVIQKLTDEKTKEIDNVFEEKKKEIMQI